MLTSLSWYCSIDHRIIWPRPQESRALVLVTDPGDNTGRGNPNREWILSDVKGDVWGWDCSSAECLPSSTLRDPPLDHIR